MKQEHVNEIKGIIILALGLILLASFVSFVPEDLPWYASHPNIPAHNLIRITGAYIAGALFFVFGYSAYLLVIFLLVWSWNKLLSREIRLTFSKCVSFFVLSCVMSSLLSLLAIDAPSARFQRAGFVGLAFSGFLVRYCGVTGSYIILAALGALALILTGEVLVSPFFIQLSKAAQDVMEMAVAKFQGLGLGFKAGRPERAKAKPKVPSARFAKEEEDEDIGPVKPMEPKGKTPVVPEPPKAEKPAAPNIKIFKPAEKNDKPPVEEKPKVVGEFHLPSLDLLNDAPKIPASAIQDNLMNGAKVLESTLADFGVAVRVADIERGPVITRYELEPAPGVRVGKIVALSDDIALAMRAHSVRIEAPIPGRNRVGVEVPNGATAMVFLKDVLAQSEFRKSGSKLMLALGKDISGKSMIADLSDMPHLLIAGTTGSGKTVCLNSLIMSILFNASPEEVKFIMVDPKMVELAPYNDLPHCLCPVITDHKKVSAALNWVVGEMESRYRTLSKEGVRNIKGYQQKGLAMPYIVVVVDELADLMQVSAKTIESAITRLAQLARAVGIHLVLATQRPSVDVITGVIKANFPARISFKVASKVDSRTVLDMNGAQDLLGKGDLLFIKPGDAKPTRGQCSFVTDDEIRRVIDFIKVQSNPQYDENVTKHQAAAGGGGSEEKDEMYDEAVRVVIETNQASVSILQRRLRLGYTRAARLIDMMELDGLVGPYCGSKAREILVDREKWMLDHMGTTDEQAKG